MAPCGSGGGGQAAEPVRFYERNAPAALRLAYLLTGDRSVAEDITQDAFVRVSGRLAHLRDGGAFDAYLRRAVVNLAKNHFRRRAVERAYLERTRPEAATAGHEHPYVEREATMAALARLPQRQRAAIVLRSTRTSRRTRSPRSCGVATAPFVPS